MTGASPERWASAFAACAARVSAERVVAEANQGGAMVEQVLRAAQASLPIRLVHATRGKAARAWALAHHGLDRFLSDWNQLLEEVTA